MLSSDTWEMVAAAGLLLSVVAGIVEGPWAAVVFSLLYGSAMLGSKRWTGRARCCHCGPASPNVYPSSLVSS